MNTSKIREILLKYGISTQYRDYTTRPFYDVLKDIADEWDAISDDDKYELYKSMGLSKN